ncbi:replication initiation protein [Psychrobacillus sp. FSL H8-0510]|uniref:replication initiation protein n=1 Tax=Psychrobacillus sp. FSL H8-0510 TaxID=2921394 RepID=UPI0030FAB91F
MANVVETVETNLVELLINKDNTVTKSNLLIEASYKLTATQFKLIQTVFSNIQPNDISTNTYIFPIKQFLELLELKGQSAYTELRSMTRDVLSKPIDITIEDEAVQINWFSMVKYNSTKGTITIEIHPFWEKYLLSLTSNFTSYKLFNITNLKSIYSLRIYELLKSRINLNSTRTISLQELRTKMGIDPGQYPMYSNFKQRILLQAQKELKAESDIYFEFNEIKKGRAVDKIEFHIFRNSRKEVITPINIESNLLEPNLKEFGLKPKAISKLVENYSTEQIERNIEYSKNKINLGEVNNPAAYVKSAIEQDYANQALVLPKKMDKQDQQLKNLIVDNDIVNKTRYDISAEEMERHLIVVKELKESLSAKEEDIRNEIYKQLMDYQRYQDSTYDKLVSPNRFTDGYIQNICREVLSNLFIISE